MNAMNATDLFLQMVSSNAWDLPAVAVSNQNTATGSSSFQAMLEERQSQLTKPSEGQKDETPEKEPVEELPAQSGADDGQEPDQNVDLLALSAAMLGQGIPQIQTQVVEPETVDAAAVAATLTQTAAPEVQQTALPQAAAAEVLPAAAQQPQEIVQQADQQPQETKAAVPATLPDTQAVTPAPKESGSPDLSENTQEGPALSRPKEQAEVLETSGNWETPVFQKTEYVPVKVGESVTVDTTAPAQEMDAAMSKTLISAMNDGSQHVEIQLSPANLGTVVAEFTRSPEGVLHVVLRAENEHAAKLLSEHANALGLLLQDGTHSEVRVEVPQSQERQFWQQPDQNGGQQQQQQQQQRQSHVPQEEAETFLHQLRLGLLQPAPEAV